MPKNLTILALLICGFGQLAIADTPADANDVKFSCINWQGQRDSTKEYLTGTLHTSADTTTLASIDFQLPLSGRKDLNPVQFHGSLNAVSVNSIVGGAAIGPNMESHDYANLNIQKPSNFMTDLEKFIGLFAADMPTDYSISQLHLVLPIQASAGAIINKSSPVSQFSSVHIRFLDSASNSYLDLLQVLACQKLQQQVAQ